MLNKKVLSIVMMLTLTASTNYGVFAAPTTAESAELKQTQNTKKDLQSKIQQLDKEIDEVLKKVDSNKKDMNKLAENIKTTHAKLQAVENISKEHDELFKKRVRAMYISGHDSYLGVVLTSDNLSDFTSKVDTISKIMEFDKDILSKLKKEKEDISKETEVLDAENNKLLSLKQSNESTLAKLNKDVKEQKEFLDKASEKEKELLANEPSKATSASTSSKGPTLSRGAASLSYSKVMNMEATAYCGDGITASGASTKRNPDGYSTIAVDPRVIPLGSKVYVEGYGYAVAADTGGAIKGNIIDVFLTSESEAQNWGRRQVTVYILN